MQDQIKVSATLSFERPRMIVIHQVDGSNVESNHVAKRPPAD